MPPATPSAHVSDRLVSNIQELPLWVKQVIYLKLQQELIKYFVPDSLRNMTAEDTVAFFVPRLTPQGERVIPDLKGDMKELLEAAQQKMAVLDVCLKFAWSLEHCSQCMVEAMKSQWLQTPVSAKAMGTIEYMANQIRLGEYLLKMGRINQDQLDQALRTQQYIKEALEEHSGIANILINLGYITRKDTEGILFLKEEAGKPPQDATLFRLLA